MKKQSVSPLVTVDEAAKIACLSHWAYRRTVLVSDQHPRPISDTRPLRFRRIDIEAFLGVVNHA